MPKKHWLIKIHEVINRILWWKKITGVSQTAIAPKTNSKKLKMSKNVAFSLLKTWRISCPIKIFESRTLNNNISCLNLNEKKVLKAIWPDPHWNNSKNERLVQVSLLSYQRKRDKYDFNSLPNPNHSSISNQANDD